LTVNADNKFSPFTLNFPNFPVIFHGNSDKSINLGKQNTENAFAADTNYRSKYYTNTHTDEIKQPQKVKHLNKPNPPIQKKGVQVVGEQTEFLLRQLFLQVVLDKAIMT